MSRAETELVDVAPPRALLAGTAYAIRGIFTHRELLGLLVRRELKARYKDSSLGFLWSLLRPITQLLIYYVAVGQFLGAERSIPLFAIYIYAGLSAWALFSEIISGATNSIVVNAALIKKVWVPRELFPLAAVGSALFNFGIQFVILISACLLTGSLVLSPDLALVPLAFVTMILFATAIGLFLSAVNVYLRDVQHLVEVALIVLFWASPIVYSFDMVHDRLGGNWLEQLYLLNPMTLVVIGFQQALWAPNSAGPDFAWPSDVALRLGVVAVVSLVLVWVAQRVFARLEGDFAQEV